MNINLILSVIIISLICSIESRSLNVLENDPIKPQTDFERKPNISSGNSKTCHIILKGKH